VARPPLQHGPDRLHLRRGPCLWVRRMAVAMTITSSHFRRLQREGRAKAKAAGVKFGRKPKLSEFQRKEALKRRAAGETLAEIAKSYAVDISMISRLS
jgi:DNA invertase Pin-like site-specific DNA recombinase